MQKYNGYSNYPTWNVALWIDNDCATYHMRLGIMNDANNIHEASQRLEEWF